jgi:hypothetical protein
VRPPTTPRQPQPSWSETPSSSDPSTPSALPKVRRSIMRWLEEEGEPLDPNHPAFPFEVIEDVP